MRLSCMLRCSDARLGLFEAVDFAKMHMYLQIRPYAHMCECSVCLTSAISIGLCCLVELTPNNDVPLTDRTCGLVPFNSGQRVTLQGCFGVS